MASLAAVMMTFFTAQQQSSVLDVMGTRAYQAARAGIEWGAYQVLQNSMPCANSSNIVPLVGTMNAFTVKVDVTCGSSTTYYEGTTQVIIYNLTSTATLGQVGQPDYFERQLSVTLAK